MKKILTISLAYLFAVSLLVYINPKADHHPVADEKASSSLQSIEEHFNGPAEFLKFQRDIRTAEGESKPGYRNGYKLKELNKATEAANRFASRTKTTNGVVAWTERGPANVPGRTRGLLVDPDDASKNTWFAGSAGGGVWKTSNGGQSWTNLTPDLPVLSTTVLAMAESNHNIIYAGTGEGFGNLDAIDGTGIFKSTDRGTTWNQVTSTLDFPDVNRIVVDPTNPNIIVVATNGGIYRTTDGGATTWTEVLNENFIQDLKITPGNFSIQYAAQNGVGVWKSTDSGISWTLSNTNMGALGRVELAVSPVNTNRIFASAEKAGDGSSLLMSNDGALTWSIVVVNINGAEVDFLGGNLPNDGQGWYDNTIACSPFNQNVIYFAGIDMFQLELGASSGVSNVFNLQPGGTEDFLALTSFTGSSNGNFDVGPSVNNTSIEIRFGPGKSQKAHRFMVPEGASSGVAASNYIYQNYVDVPFEVWDISADPERQLMVSFRDQGRDGGFNLIPSNTTSSTATEQSREYLFINNVSYNASIPNSSITVNGGHEFNEMYNIWPTLEAGGVWPPATNSTLGIIHGTIELFNANTINITDGRGTFGNGKNNNVHVDHHNILMIPMSASTFKILNANDGGVFVSNTAALPGINNGDWTMAGNTYNTSQFYGADKRTGAEQYLGGMQDNGTWLSLSGQTASAASDYVFKIGGDGFEVIWNNRDPQLLIGGSQGNGFARSVNGGTTWTSATSGLSGDAPFISKLANSRALPDRIFSLSSAGVFVSNNFGQSWELTPITSKWSSGSFMDIEVSRANANVVWAGLGMTDDLSIHVSTNGGASFTATNNYTDVTMGGITKLASHPTESQTAYALFSLASKPKILKTTNLGNTWTDISGFGNNSTSATGFPDVAVYCLYVRPDNTNIIWAGTEIGIVESLDGGATWNILNDFHNASVWDMKGVDDQIVIATHGRGIWTATINVSQSELPNLPKFETMGTSPSEKLATIVTSSTNVDSLQVLVNDQYVGTVKDIPAGEIVVEIGNLAFGQKTIRGIAFINGAPYFTNSITGTHVDLKPTTTSHTDYFLTGSNFSFSGFRLSTFDGQENQRSTLHSTHNYSTDANYTAMLLVPITVASSNATLKYRDVAIVEPGNDFVSIETTQDGVHWLPIEPKYDASFNAAWMATFASGGKGTYAQMVSHEINLLSTIAAGTKVLFRMKLTSNSQNQAWGWAIDYLAIQEEPTEAEFNSVLGKTTLYPNPAQVETTVSYTLTNKSDVSIELVNTLGQRISTIGRKDQSVGIHSETFAVSQLKKGTYLVTIRTKNGAETHRLVIQ